MRPFVKSYGVISTVTRSPASIRIRFFFILPGEYASVSCPLSSFTRKRASGRSSSTVPSNSIRSSFAKQLSSIKDEGARAPPRQPSALSSDRAQIHRGNAAALALLELITEFLAFTQVVHPRAFDGGDVYKDVSARSFGLDEPVTLLRAEPFDRTGRH